MSVGSRQSTAFSPCSPSAIPAMALLLAPGMLEMENTSKSAIHRKVFDMLYFSFRYACRRRIVSGMQREGHCLWRQEPKPFRPEKHLVKRTEKLVHLGGGLDVYGHSYT